MAVKTQPTGKTIVIRLPTLVPRDLRLVLLLGAVAAIGVLAYLFHGEISDAYFDVQQALLATFGLGVLVMAVWLAVSIGIAVWRWRWIRGWPKVWAGSGMVVFLAIGIMAFFRPETGVMGDFARDGDVTLGGHVGLTITGSAVWLGVLRLLGLGLVIALTVGPRATTAAAVTGSAATGRAMLFAYLWAAVAAARLASWLRGMYRFQPRPKTPTKSADDQGLGSGLRSALAGIGPASDTPPPRGYASGLPLSTESLPANAGDVLPTPAFASPMPDSGVNFAIEPEVGLDTELEAPVQEGEADPDSARYNMYWDSAPENDRGTDVYPRAYEDLEASAEGADDGEPDDPSAPITDANAAAWSLPSMDILKDQPAAGISQAETDATAETIVRTLAEYDIEVEIGGVRPGPTVTMYGLVPGWVRRYKQVKALDEEGNPDLNESGKPVMTRAETKTRVKVDSILSREKDLSLALKTPSIRIETPVMGESLVGIEVPNPTPDLVTLRSVMEGQEFERILSRGSLPIALGKGSGGETAVVDLAKMPHLLVAGATGSGKSVCLNTIVSCLIMEKSPAEVRLLLIDPKRVELTPFNGIPHLLTPVVVETDEVVGLLKGMINEMLNRYRRMEKIGVRNIHAYNEKRPDKMPFLVVAIDELADLMMSASFDVEQSLCRLAQLGRATGIHLIVATQRPSVDVVTGLIKANFPSRISYAVTSQIDSRTILDSAGAEKLLGRGDMLYLAQDASRPERVQGVFISDSEVEELVRFWTGSRWAPLPRIRLRPASPERATDGGQDQDGLDSRDELLDKAIEMAQQQKKLSTSLLQRRLRIGYPRAARLMDQLEDEGIVGPSDGSKSRDVIIS